MEKVIYLFLIVLVISFIGADSCDFSFGGGSGKNCTTGEECPEGEACNLKTLTCVTDDR